jgi:hypothetical protein
MKEIYIRYKAKGKKVNYLTVLEEKFIYWRELRNELDTYMGERQGKQKRNLHS